MLFSVVCEEGEDIVVGELVSAIQEGEFDEKGDGDDFSAEVLYEPAGSSHGSAGS